MYIIMIHLYNTKQLKITYQINFNTKENRGNIGRNNFLYYKALHEFNAGL